MAWGHDWFCIIKPCISDASPLPTCVVGCLICGRKTEGIAGGQLLREVILVILGWRFLTSFLLGHADQLLEYADQKGANHSIRAVVQMI